MNNEYDYDADEGEEIEIEALGIEVNTQPIELYKVMKLANLVSGGGEAKYAISEGYVAVNGELETRKRRKLYDGDFFEFNQEYYVVVYNEQQISEPNEEVIVQEVDDVVVEDVIEPPAVTDEPKPAPSDNTKKKPGAGRKSLDFL